MDEALLSRTLVVLGGSWPSMVLGIAIVLATTFLGWAIGRHRGFPLVRWVGFWVRYVVLPLIRQRSCIGRAVGIFVNNIAILSGLVAVGAIPGAAFIAAALLGLSLGIALRLLMGVEEPFTPAQVHPTSTDAWRVRIGVSLNLLEPPAIAVALGLSLGSWQAAGEPARGLLGIVPLPTAQTWETFAVWVVPAMVLAACGESLWLGVFRESTRRAQADPPFVES